jgi:hypothetical protein
MLVQTKTNNCNIIIIVLLLAMMHESGPWGLYIYIHICIYIIIFKIIPFNKNKKIQVIIHFYKIYFLNIQQIYIIGILSKTVS